jgi:hypothetical protein
MGWWKCNCNGGIDFKNKPSGHSGGTLINAIPGRDTTEDYYNGDPPADTMFFPTAVLKDWFKDKPKPTVEQLTALFTEKSFDPIFDHIPRSQLEKLIDATWKEIDAVYWETWNRPTYPEERAFICKFSFGGANRPKLRDFWNVRPIDKQNADNYRAGKLPYSWRTS